jgi:uncharacterized protein (TIGR02453 family)
MKPYTLKFLKDLKSNNKKIWFDAHRKQYNEAKKDFLNDYEAILLGIANFDENVERNIDNCRKIFRINRDARFSKDKTPYKNNFGASVYSGDRENTPPIYYIHVEPTECGIAIGEYMPDATRLQKIREYIAKHYLDFEDIIFDRDFGEEWGELSTEMTLKRPPVGFDANHPAIKYLKLKSFTFWKPLKDTDLLNKNYVEKSVNSFKKAYEFIQFMNKAIK